MVSAILLHYVIDDPLPTRNTFVDPGSNSGADNFFFLAFLFSYMLSSFSTCSYYLNCFFTWYVWLLLEKKLLEPCHLHLVLSTCLVVVAVKSKNIIIVNMLIKLGEGDKAQKYVKVVLQEFYEYGTGTLF